MAQKFNNDSRLDDGNGKLKEFAHHNPTIIGEPRPLEPADIDRRLGGLPNVLAYAHQWIATGVDPRAGDQQDIPMLMICQMARQSGFMEVYAISRQIFVLSAINDNLHGISADVARLADRAAVGEGDVD